MMMLMERQTYEITVGKYLYRLKRERSRYADWKWSWTVHGGSLLRSRWCDPEKPTYKRVVAAAEKWLSEHDEKVARV
jgi:hypothetical protein